MGVTQTTDQQFQPTAMTAYNTMMPQMQNTLSQFMNNPLQANYFNQMFGLGSNQINQQQQGNMTTLMNNMKQFGMGGNNPFMLSQMAQAGRQGSAQKSGLFGGLLQQAIGNQMGAANIASGFKPLNVGQTQTMNGLGTWLPQLIGGGLSALSGMGGMGGGLPFGGNLGMPAPSNPMGGSPIFPMGNASGAPDISMQMPNTSGFNFGGSLSNGPMPYYGPMQ